MKDLEDLLGRHRQLKRTKEAEEEKSLKRNLEEKRDQKPANMKVEGDPGDVKKSPKDAKKSADEITGKAPQIKEENSEASKVKHETLVVVKEEEERTAGKPETMTCEDSSSGKDEQTRYHRKRRCKSDAQSSSKKTKIQPAPQSKPKYPQASDEDPFEIVLLYNVINKCRKLKSTAKEGLRKRWKPESDAAKRFLDACKGFDRVDIEEVEDLKSKTKVYCICKKIAEDVFMIGCDKCDEWYHPKCIGMSEESARNLDSFVCGRCRTPPA
uniref:PHD-type domain-containing protein n=1 Tax=Lotharella oceanica TaxID=641309 RepID=A0A7S2TQ10_9EUKA